MEKSMTVKTQRVGKREKISNDFLLQFAYNIAASILLMYIYNSRLYRYGSGIGMAMPVLLWSGFGLFAAAAAAYAVLWRLKGRNGYKVAAIYLGATALGFFWCIGVQVIAAWLAYRVGLFPPFFGFFANAAKQIQMLFYAVALAVAVEIGFYIYRMRQLSKAVKKKRK